VVDITPLLPGGRQIVESYGGGGFRVSGQRYQGSILVLPDRTLAWPVTSFPEITLDSLAPLLAPAPAPGELRAELLLIGCGPRLQLLPGELRRALRTQGLVCEAMDTGAACRTYNVLLAEGRAVAAALVAVE
jgi:uncharacterized protein